ncbi:MAG: SRPBCC family protein [Dehalococcoidia bacterium]
MARIEESVEIKRPVEKVFAYTIDAKDWSKWLSFIPEAEQTSQGPISVGTTFKGSSRLIGHTNNWTAKTVECEPNKSFGADTTGPGIIMKEHYTYSSVNGGTKFTIVYDIRMFGLYKLSSLMVISNMRKELKNSLINLKSILEAQA